MAARAPGSTAAGRNFHRRVRFEVHIPVWLNAYRPRNHTIARYDRENGGDYRRLNVRDIDLPVPPDIGVVRDAADLAAKEHFIYEAVHRWLEKERNEQENGVYVNREPGADRVILRKFDQSGLYWTYNDRAGREGFKIDWEGVHFDHGPPTSEVLLGRPLRGKFKLPPEMLWALDLET